MNSLSTFTFQQDHNVRVQMIDNEPWFCLRDICSVLGLDARSSSKFDLDLKGVEKLYTPSNGGNQQLNFVNEPNLYRVIFRSNKAEAKQFQDWVFNEVLPSIRKTGKYEIPSQLTENKPVVVKSKPAKKVPTANTIDLDNPEQLRRALLTYTDRVINLEEKVGQLQAVEKKLDKISNMEGLMLMSDMAKLLQEKPHEFMHRLAEMKWIFRRSAKAPWSASQQMILLGLLEQKMDMITHANGQVVVTHQVLVTAKGIRKLLDIDNGRKMNQQNNMLY